MSVPDTAFHKLVISMSTSRQVRFLFWNVKRRNLGDHLRELADAHNPDVVILCEPPGRWRRILDELNRDRDERQFLDDPLGEQVQSRFTIFSRISSNAVEPIKTTDRAAFWALNEPVGLLLVAVHGPDRRNSKASDRNLFARHTSDQIRQIEEERRHRRTIVVGDFNINPYEEGMMGAGMFHAAMTSRTARRGERQAQGVPYPLFYNPMWSLFGDRTPGPAGTFYHCSPGATARDWHMLDQLIMRSELIDSFHSIEIVAQAGSQSLLTREGLPDKAGASDHLPLLFHFEFHAGESNE